MWVAEGHTPRWLWLWGCGCHLRIEGLCSMTTHPFCPMVIPIAHPIVVAFYPGWAIANFAVLVWQGDTPDSGGAAIMGVPLPHLVLPLSGCLSRHTPTRAKRGEARGHRSVLAQNSLLMHPPPFVFLWICRRHGVSLSAVGLTPMCLRCCVCIPAWCRLMARLCGHVGRR